MGDYGSGKVEAMQEVKRVYRSNILCFRRRSSRKLLKHNGYLTLSFRYDYWIRVEWKSRSRGVKGKSWNEVPVYALRGLREG